MAFHTPGGGEIQLVQYRKVLEKCGVSVQLFNQWEPCFLKSDIVHFFSCMTGSVHFCAFVKKIGLPLIVSPNLWITEETKRNYPYDEIRTIFVLADKVIGNSEMECNLLAKVFNVPREKFVTVYNGFESSFLIPVDGAIFRSTFGIKGPFILNVANLEKRKNQLNLIKAIKDFPDLTLVLVGHIRDSEYAQCCIKEGGEQVRYIGALPHGSDLLRSALASCSIFALPSTLETPGLAALEAFACGLPTLITSDGSAREYFGEAVVYVDHQEVQSIKNGIETLIARPKSFLQTVVAAANFNWHKVVSQLKNIYSDYQADGLNHFEINGFHAIEVDTDIPFAWSRASASFECRSGSIQWMWRSEGEVLVNISIDGKLSYKECRVMTSWSTFRIVIPVEAARALHDIKVECLDSLGNPLASANGVALREMDFCEASDSRFNQLVGLDTWLRNSEGFHHIELATDRCLVWTRYAASVYTCAGRISFLWRSSGNAFVDLWLDEVLWMKGINVGESWSQFQFDIPPFVDLDKRKIKIVIVNNLSVTAPQSRELGIAFSDVICRIL